MADIFSSRAEAGGESLTSGTKTGSNSQTLALLESSSASPILDKKTTKKDLPTGQAGDKSNEKSSTEETELDEDTTVNISNGALLPAATAATPDEDSTYNDGGEYDLEIYVVRRGDTVPQIANMFEITSDTIYSANDLVKGSKVKEGDVLIILPSSGVDYKIKKGDTLKGIANKFKVPVEDIAGHNGITGSKITIGSEIFIPGGSLEAEVKKSTKSTSSTASTSSSKTKYSSSIDTTGYFTHPVPGSVRVRGITSAHKGVDFGAPTGTPIYAAAAGRVIFSKDGWNGRYGNLIIIQHDNGTRTLYAHQSRRVAQSGERVEKGELIGYVGSTGRSTGPHLHFEVQNGKNPL